MKLLRLLLAAAAVAALLVGCGGSSSSSAGASSASPPGEAEPESSGGAARAAYVREADAVCRANDEVTAALNAEIGAVTKSGNPETPRAEAKLGELLVRLVFLGREEGKELASIQPPAADRAAITRWIGTGQEGLSELEAAALALEKGSAAKFGSLYAEGLATLGRARKIVRGYGFKVCGGEVQTIR